MLAGEQADAVAGPEQRAYATCGIVMPISALDGCGTEHWMDVQNIIKEAVDAIKEPKFTARLVSESDEIGVIQKRIVQSLYNSDIIICDVSGKNPNVMFELGMRLAFDKPTVIIKDDKTEYSFDTGIIEHVEYPRDLRFSRIVEFKKRLSQKIVGSLAASDAGPNHSPFLKNFGQFKVTSLHESEVSPENAILTMLTDLQRDIALLKTRSLSQPIGLQRELLVRGFVHDLFARWQAEGEAVPTAISDVTGDIYDSIRRQIETGADIGEIGDGLLMRALHQVLKERHRHYGRTNG